MLPVQIMELHLIEFVASICAAKCIQSRTCICTFNAQLLGAARSGQQGIAAETTRSPAITAA